jgi:hypothetical protein
LYSDYLTRAPKTAGKLAGDFAEVAFWVLKSRCPEGGNLSVDQVNMHLNNIALKHAAHDPSKTFLFIPKEGECKQFLVEFLIIKCRGYCKIRCTELCFGRGNGWGQN